MQSDQIALSPAPVSLFVRLRSWLATGIPCASDVRFALVTSLLWATLYNSRFWHATFESMWHPTVGAAGFIASLFVFVVCVQAILLMLMPTRTVMRVAASLLFVIASLSAYFTSAYGAIMNKEMMRNVIDTDPAEVGGLVSGDLLAHLLILGVLPAVLVWFVRLPPLGIGRQWRQRAIFVGAALAVCAVGLFSFSANYAVFFREHKPIRYMLSPSAPVASMIEYGADVGRHRDGNRPLLNPAGNSQRVAAPGAKPLVVFMVVGETARAADFQLNGYERATNPELARIQNLAYFRDAKSCGTATAVSVPCMFSSFDRADFDVSEASHYTNLLDALTGAGLAVEWRDNNAGCKGVCARVPQVQYTPKSDPTLCPNSYCYDEVMLNGLEERLQNLTQDTVFVFHQIGSHGPAYSERYPPKFEIFKPACRSNRLETCTPQEVRNAYDNTIAYTDYVLSRQIALLQSAASKVDGVLIYASDHGESLGEQGVYLHGLPYAFAPATQKEVPMLVWTTPGYAQRARLEPGCLQARARDSASHDNIYHTVLGAAEVRNHAYDPRLDLLGSCRSHE
jgi:lipid A ethanolaminephosphotransferase